ncbi:hypothetical protein ACIQKE_16550 [Streptomyces griseoviridis]|uniref:ATP-binding protein n=2 Tax=Streptomyces TaxID=1883 RepID=A0A3S9ZCV8_STRGD|nr:MULTISPECIES: hypothetical protein [Streptomyces]AZS85417.1 hypothetical protein ELQ87_14755 [Streptomyces griseoviridis]MDH6698982.1 hypothetical protein [Streptomyces sp. MAA16]MDT0473481.1 hypothetical protein [Streptomyces sp. DSM 41014]QCN87728.1 hypothetical protein DDJ31_24540 [Streptomyces griseoviridis]
MARQAPSPRPTAQRALIALATAGAALGAGAATASAADSAPVVDVMRTRPTSLGKIDPQSGLQALTGSVGYVTGPLAGLKPNPLAGTGVDPLDNGVGTQLADFKALNTQMLTAPVAQASSIGNLPLVGQATGLLGGLGG